VRARDRYTPEAYRRLRAVPRQRRMAFLEGKVCEGCGSPDSLQVTWANPPGPLRVGKIWQYGPDQIAAWLTLLKVQCLPCRNRKSVARQRNEHGGGALGIAACKCAPCRKRRSQYAVKWRQDKRARQQALEALPKRPRGTMGQ
jgi:hypothetical protein